MLIVLWLRLGRMEAAIAMIVVVVVPALIAAVAAVSGVVLAMPVAGTAAMVPAVVAVLQVVSPPVAIALVPMRVRAPALFLLLLLLIAGFMFLRLVRRMLVCNKGQWTIPNTNTVRF